LVRVKAVSLNYRDLLMAKGLYNPKQPLPLVPCSDAAGEVVKVGAGVTRVATGDRVASSFFQRWTSGEPTKAKLLSALAGPSAGRPRPAPRGRPRPRAGAPHRRGGGHAALRGRHGLERGRRAGRDPGGRHGARARHGGRLALRAPARAARGGAGDRDLRSGGE